MGVDVLTVHAEVDFKATARLGEVLNFGVRVGKVGRTSITFELESWVESDERITSTGNVVFVCVHPTEHTPVEVPTELIDAFSALHTEPLK